MKLSEIRAAIKAKANSTNMEPFAPATPEPISTSTPVKPQIVKNSTTRKKNTSKPVAINENDPIPPVANFEQNQPTSPPKRESKSKPSKSSSNNTPVTENIEIIVRKYLKPNQDYAVIPNTKKPTLLKGGAEKLASIFRFTTSCSIVNRIEHFDYDNPATSFVQYEAKVIVYNLDGTAVSEGYGSCNSSESKFLRQPFANRINTVLKISKKRAYVDAILTATSASGIFTQDMEDIANFQDSSNQNNL